MSRSRSPSVIRIQGIFILILAISAAQVIWWIIDQSLYAQAVHDRWMGLYEADVVAAIALQDRGARVESIRRLFPHLDVSLDDGVSIAPNALALLEEERRAHVSQYAWEGAFFLAVVLCGLWVILRTVRRDAQLRRWQANFLAAVSHELKSPLASLQLAAETLEIREHDAGYRRQLVRRILEDAERLSSTVGDVLDTHRLDRGSVRAQRRTLALSDVVSESLAEQDFRAQAQNVALRTDVPKGLTIEADPTSVQTVLRNLLDNALKATQGGGHIDLRARGENDRVRLDVADSGVGFAREESGRLFQKFYRIGDELRRTQAGSGLGLYLARRFVELDGGTLTATSEGPGRGAVFTATWPRPSE